MAVAGISTLGITFGYALETTANTKPAAFTQLSRINGIGGIKLDTERIDASAIEDVVSSYVAGRSDTGGEWTVTINLTDATQSEWETLIAAYNGRANDKQMWFEVIVPGVTDAFFVVAQPPQQLPLPEMGQNELLTCEIVLTIVEYKGMDTKVAFS